MDMLFPEVTTQQTNYRRKVLIVDDSKTFQQVLKISLNQNQWELFFVMTVKRHSLVPLVSAD